MRKQIHGPLPLFDVLTCFGGPFKDLRYKQKDYNVEDFNEPKTLVFFC